ncbi:hypothetical protein AQPE_2415 [Aquipluma nitroreducens]|uniref:Uncharacterized protein n=1 Tax=Aquipluma nitroreducens TaxID=2010828 RepID=A0A5K7S9J3_9BACT|nr:hypothetical protein [Aquipluma nitroreducens]BBE18253.1 hypothetical protein AQPE_2415 [Aquipluma nitroreducens]
MKISRINRVAGTFLALIVTAGAAVSNNNPDGKNRNNSPQETCVNSISGLSEYQKDRIVAMETQNQKVMNDLRERQHSASGKAQREEIKKQIDKQIENHGNTIKTVLSADQQRQYIQFQSNGGNPNPQGQRQGAGKGSGRGSGSGGGRGNGNKCRM